MTRAIEVLEQRIAPAGVQFIVNNVNDSEAGSLRQAILDANAEPGSDSIVFDIPGTAGTVFTIAPFTELPEITDPVVIDGYTQSGARPNTNPAGGANNAVLTIELDGRLSNGDGLTVSTGGTTITGLIINGFSSEFGSERNPYAGITLTGTGAVGNVISGNFIGTDSSGFESVPNERGIAMLDGARNSEVRGNVISNNLVQDVFIGGPSESTTSGNIVAGNLIGTTRTGTEVFGGSGGVFIGDAIGNTIGGVTPADRNVIAGFADIGISISSNAPTGSNVIEGNYIGVDVTGEAGLGDGQTGITISGESAGNRISNNVISNSQINGIVIGRNGIFGTDGTVIQSNRIGTDVTGTVPIPNGASGIFLSSSAAGTVIGGVDPRLGNVIAHNGGNPSLELVPAGIKVTDNAFGTEIQGNYIFDNGGLGIDLGEDGINFNDDGDRDGGANDLQNFPTITSTTSDAESTAIGGVLSSTPNRSFRLEFFANSNPDDSGYGEGETPLGSLMVTTDVEGNAEFSFSGTGDFRGQYFTATATDLTTGSTSEFSEARPRFVEPQEFVWDGSAGTDWFTPANWTPDGVPGQGDTAILNINATISLASDAVVASFQQSSGTLQGAGALSVISDFVWSGGTQGPGGTTSLGMNATASFTGTANKSLNGRALENGGTFVWDGTGDLIATNGATFLNLSGATVDLQADAEVRSGGSGVEIVIQNAGTWQKSAGTGVSSVLTGIFTNTGVVRSASGTVDFTRQVNANGTFEAVGGALTFHGTTTLNGSVVFAGADLAGGTLNGSGTVDGSWKWTGGAITTPSLVVPSTGVLTLSGTIDKTLNGGRIDNNGQIAMFGTTGLGRLVSVNGAIINNLAGSLFDLKSDASLIYGGSGSDLAFNNFGTVLKSAGTSFSSFGAGNFVNQPGGIVRSEMGALFFPNAVTANGEFTATGGGALRFTGAVTLGNAVTFNRVELAGGTIKGTGTVTGAWTWSSGSLGATGTMTIPASSSLTLIGADDKTINNYTVTNNGSVIWTGAGDLITVNSAVINNNAGGLFDLRNDEPLLYGGSGADLVFNNAGTVLKSAGSGVSSLAPGRFVNTGLVRAASGTIDFTKAVTAGGTFDANAGTILLHGTTTLSSAVNFNDVELAGILTGTGTITGDWTWSSGTLQGGGTVTIPATSTVAMVGAADKFISNYTIANNGTIRWNGTGDLIGVNGAVFNNNAGAVFDLQNSQLLGFGGSGANILFNNAGTVVKSAGAGTSTFAPLNFVNTGTVRAAAGVIDFTTAVSAAGTFEASPGAIVLHGTTTLNESVNFLAVSLAGGTLTGTGTVTGNWTWSEGTFSSPGALTIPEGSSLTLISAGDKLLNGYTINNNGTVVLTGTGDLISTNGPTFNNNAGGRFRIQNDEPIRFGGSGSNLGFNNAGLVTKSGSTGTTVIASGLFANTGTVESLGGVLNFTGPVGANGSFLSSGGALTLNGTTSLNGAVTFQNVELAGGNLTGTGTVSGPWTWSGGSMSGGGAVTIAANGILRLVGDAQKTINNYTLANGGVVAFTGAGLLSGVNSARFNNLANGTVDLQSDAGLTYGGSGTVTRFDNSGILRKSGGSGESPITATFSSTGSVAAEAGTLRFQSFTQSAGATRLAGGNLASTSTLIFQSGVLEGGGTIAGNVSNTGATLQPGGAGGIDAIAITGNYTQGPAGILRVDLGGATAETYDRLTVSGTALLNGALQYTEQEFSAQTGDVFEVLSAATRTGEFSSVTGTAASLAAIYGPGNVTLQAVGGPIVVTTTLDVVNGEDGVTSLREAILTANQVAGADTIIFNIPGSGVQTIRPTSALPELMDAVLLDGYTQPGATPNTQTTGTNANLLIALSGSEIRGSVVDGLSSSAANVTIRGLVIGDFTGAAIQLTKLASQNVLAGNFIGTNAAGTVARGNDVAGILIDNGTNHIIGGDSPEARNIIAGSDGAGVLLRGSLASGNVVAGNYIGTDLSGSAALANTVGVQIEGGAHDNRIGGTGAGEGNVISGNGDGVVISGFGASGNRVEGNLIGLNATGATALGNLGRGVLLLGGASGNTIGGSADGAGNVISGNGRDGVALIGSSSGGGNEVGELPGERDLPGFRDLELAPNDDSSVEAQLGFTVNFFGTEADRLFVNNNGNLTFGAPSGEYTPTDLNSDNGGIPIIAAFFADVDTTADGSKSVTYGTDLISGREVFGVDYFDVGYFSDHDDLLNRFQLLIIERGDTGTGNFDIEFNYSQIQFETGDSSGGEGGFGGSSARVGYSNGTGAGGTFFELDGSGENGAFLDGGPKSLIEASLGSSTPGRIRFEVRDGVVQGSPTENIVAGNLIGMDASGNNDLGNGAAGVLLSGGASGNQIGDAETGAGNQITASTGAGIRVIDAASTGNLFSGNLFFRNGGLAIDLGGDGPTANDAGDGDTGPNGLQNVPLVVRAVANEGSDTTSINGILRSTPNSVQRIEFFETQQLDSSGRGSGEIYRGFLDVTVNSEGEVAFTAELPGRSPLGTFITATASSADGTSEFSPGEVVTPPALISVADTAIVEGQNGNNVAVFQVRLDQASVTPVTVHFSTNDLVRGDAATAGSDYGALEGDITFAPGELLQTISVDVFGDRTQEARERFGITLSDANGAGLDRAEATAAILDDDHHLFYVGKSVGAQVEIHNSITGRKLDNFSAFSPGFRGGVRVASGDINGDGVDDLIAGTGSGGGARVRVFDGRTLDAQSQPVLLADFLAYNNAYRGGIYVASGDINGDGRADIVVSPSAGSSGQVRVFSGVDGSLLSSFTAFGRGSGGVRIAAGDVDGDGRAEIIAGSGVGSSVRVFDGASGQVLDAGGSSFRAFSRDYTGGVHVSSGDVNGDGLDDVIVGMAARGDAIRVFLSGQPRFQPLEIAGAGGSNHGIRVGTVDVNSDGIADIIAGQGAGGSPSVRIFDGRGVLKEKPRTLIQEPVFGPNYDGGLFVG